MWALLTIGSFFVSAVLGLFAFWAWFRVAKENERLRHLNHALCRILADPNVVTTSGAVLYASERIAKAQMEADALCSARAAEGSHGALLRALREADAGRSRRAPGALQRAVLYRSDDGVAAHQLLSGAVMWALLTIGSFFVSAVLGLFAFWAWFRVAKENERLRHLNHALCRILADPNVVTTSGAVLYASERIAKAQMEADAL